jgi:hypothetical protein
MRILGGEIECKIHTTAAGYSDEQTGCSDMRDRIIPSCASCSSASRSQDCAISIRAARDVSREMRRAASRHSCAWRRYSSALVMTQRKGKKAVPAN